MQYSRLALAALLSLATALPTPTSPSADAVSTDDPVLMGIEGGSAAVENIGFDVVNALENAQPFPSKIKKARRSPANPVQTNDPVLETVELADGAVVNIAFDVEDALENAQPFPSKRQAADPIDGAIDGPVAAVEDIEAELIEVGLEVGGAPTPSKSKRNDPILEGIEGGSAAVVNVGNDVVDSLENAQPLPSKRQATDPIDAAIDGPVAAVEDVEAELIEDGLEVGGNPTPSK